MKSSPASSRAKSDPASSGAKASTVPKTLTIGELAGRFDLATHVLRHWEAMGLLSPDRLSNGRRVYTEDHIMRVAMIVRSKAGGLSLTQMRDVLDPKTGTERRRILGDHLAELDRRIAEIESSRAIIEHVLECPKTDFMHCPEFRAIVERAAAM